jgi:hypothetical protein
MTWGPGFEFQSWEGRAWWNLEKDGWGTVRRELIELWRATAIPEPPFNRR